MPFYIRRSRKLGPLRLNFSKSGVGVSAGVTGARIGAGPHRGVYVHMGRGGIYYRRRLSPLPGHATGANGPVSPSLVGDTPSPSDMLPTATVEELQDASGDDIVDEVNRHRGSWIARLFGRAKPAQLTYELDGEAASRDEALNRALATVAGSSRIWWIAGRGGTGDWKRNAGARTLVASRAPVVFGPARPPHIETNVTVYGLSIGNQRWFFFPDRILVFERGKYGAVGYHELTIRFSVVRFSENEAVPRDAEVVGTTWQYVNKGGGPDRRFKNNRQIPIALYGEIELQSASGLRVVLQTSNESLAAEGCKALQQALTFREAPLPSHVPYSLSKAPLPSAAPPPPRAAPSAFTPPPPLSEATSDLIANKPFSWKVRLFAQLLTDDLHDYQTQELPQGQNESVSSGDILGWAKAQMEEMRSSTKLATSVMETEWPKALAQPSVVLPNSL